MRYVRPTVEQVGRAVNGQRVWRIPCREGEALYAAYHGCGTGLAHVRGGEVVALVYDDDDHTDSEMDAFSDCPPAGCESVMGTISCCEFIEGV